MIEQEPEIVIVRQGDGQPWRVYRNPRQVVKVFSPHDVISTLEFIENQVETRGLHAAGFVSYEAASGFDHALHVRKASDFPLVWFGLYEGFQSFWYLPCCITQALTLPNWYAQTTQKDYMSAINAIKGHLREGDSYQVNYSFRLFSQFNISPLAFFQTICGFFPAPYAAYINFDRWSICSFSPELFFILNGENLISRPMKGTRPRGLTCDADKLLSVQLASSVKDRAENLMITDMVRNDLGRLANIGSVKTKDLFKLEKHATLWQLTSSVYAKTTQPFSQILTHLFPAASITGAPKAASMDIIARLETTPRNIYTGTIGYLDPGRYAQFNVAIRTVLVDKKKGLAEYGTGGGIVWDSKAKEEFSECLAKSSVLRQSLPEFELLETLLWHPDQDYVLLQEHLQRIQQSAHYFDFSINTDRIINSLTKLSAKFSRQPRRVRVLLRRNGGLHVESQQLDSVTSDSQLIALTAKPVVSSDVFLYHKTTHRLAYTRALASRPGYSDVILYNEREELTESTRANLVLKMDGNLYTPPVQCGLLAGTLRRKMLRSGEIKERIIHKAELERAEAIYLVNSVRGMYQVHF